MCGANKSGGRIDAALGRVNERRQVASGERSERRIAANSWGGAAIGWARVDG